MKRALFLVVLSVAAWGQAPSQAVILDPSFPWDVQQYLGLTIDQVTKLGALNTQWSQYQSDKLQRQVQVQAEITAETAKDSPDPMALGVRYVELESIRRDLVAQQKSTVEQAQALLTPDQKTKLAALQQALATYPTACSAVQQNLLPSPSAASSLVTSPNSVTGVTGASVFSLLPAWPICTGAYANPLLYIPKGPSARR